jgi:hypothetical protein
MAIKVFAATPIYLLDAHDSVNRGRQPMRRFSMSGDPRISSY